MKNQNQTEKIIKSQNDREIQEASEFIEVELSGGLKSLFPTAQKYFSEYSESDAIQKAKYFIRCAIFTFFESHFASYINFSGNPFRIPHVFIPLNPVPSSVTDIQKREFFIEESTISKTWRIRELERITQQIQKHQQEQNMVGQNYPIYWRQFKFI